MLWRAAPFVALDLANSPAFGPGAVEGASSMRILITGGTGFLGRATIRVLTEAGHSVRAIVRDRAAASTALAGLARRIR